MSISIDLARRVLEACKQRARELRSPVSIAIVDAGGHLVLFERMMAPYGFATGDISIAKAHTSVMFNQSTDSVAQWAAAIPGFSASLASMTNGKFILAAGGWPIRINGVTIGGLGISGGNAPGRDDDIARAGLSVVEGMHQSQSQPTYYYQPPQPAYAAPQQERAPLYTPGAEPAPRSVPSPVSTYGNSNNGNAKPAVQEEAPHSSEAPAQQGTLHLPADEIHSDSNPYSNAFDETSTATNDERPGDRT